MLPEYLLTTKRLEIANLGPRSLPAGLRLMSWRIRLALSAPICLRNSKLSEIVRLNGETQVNGEKAKEPLLKDPPVELLIQVGKNWKRIA